MSKAFKARPEGGLSLHRSRVPTRATLILAHGAGADSSSDWIVSYAKAIALRGVRVVTFDFPKTRSSMDPLEETYRDVVARVAKRFPKEPITIGGKSMGGRVASLITAKYTLPIRNLVFLGYPLHPPDKPEKRRDAHLPNIVQPMLFISGTRDPFGTEAEMRALVTSLGSRAELVVIAGGDHSLVVPKRGSEKQEDVDARIWDLVAQWCVSGNKS